MKKQFKVIPVPMGKEGYKEGDLVKYESEYPKTIGWAVAEKNSDNTDKMWQAYDLVFVSELEEPKNGDCILMGVPPTRCDDVDALFNTYPVIHFSTNPSHNAPLIPDCFKRMFAERGGEIFEVSVEYVNKTGKDFLNNLCLIEQPRLVNNEIVVTVKNQINLGENGVAILEHLAHKQQVVNEKAAQVQPLDKTPLQMLKEKIKKSLSGQPADDADIAYLNVLREIEMLIGKEQIFAEGCFNAGGIYAHALHMNWKEPDFSTFYKKYEI